MNLSKKSRQLFCSTQADELQFGSGASQRAPMPRACSHRRLFAWRRTNTFSSSSGMTHSTTWIADQLSRGAFAPLSRRAVSRDWEFRNPHSRSLFLCAEIGQGWGGGRRRPFFTTDHTQLAARVWLLKKGNSPLRSLVEFTLWHMQSQARDDFSRLSHCCTLEIEQEATSRHDLRTPRDVAGQTKHATWHL